MKTDLRGWYTLNPILGGVILCVLMIIVFGYFYRQAIEPPAGLLVIENVKFIPTQTFSPEPYDDTANPLSGNIKGENKLHSQQLRKLPDDWLLTSPGNTQGRYLATVQLAAKPEGLWAIYLPVVLMNTRIYLNNILIGQIGEAGQKNPHDDPFVRSANRPYYFTLPTSLLKHGSNALQLQVYASNGSGLLGKIYLAEDSILRPVYNNRFAATITAKQTITAGMLAIAILMSVLWFLRRQDQVYGWYALMLYTWSAHNIFSIGVNLPLSQHTQNILSLLALGWFVVFMVKATHHYMRQRFPLREKIIFFTTISGSLILLYSDHLPWPLLITHQLWSTYVLALAGYALLDFTIKYPEQKDLHNPLILPAGFSMLVFGVHDWLLLMQLLPREEGRLLHFSAPIAVAVFGALLLERFASVLQQAESLNLELEQRVAEKHAQLEKNYLQMKKLEHKQLLTEERERFMKEIHDGVGGHLISMLSMVRSGKQDTEKLVHAIENTLDDLRIMIDSLSPQEHDIPSLLGAMRMRIEPQLESSGLKLHWRVSELPAVPDFGPHKALQVMRIVQEAITNVIRHAEARNIMVKALPAYETGHVLIEISDDGKGIAPGSKNGRGLGNISHRANEIGAALDIKSTESGTFITLIL